MDGTMIATAELMKASARHPPSAERVSVSGVVCDGASLASSWTHVSRGRHRVMIEPVMGLTTIVMAAPMKLRRRLPHDAEWVPVVEPDD